MRTQRKFWSFRTVKSPVRSFRSLAGQFLVFQVLVVAMVLVAVAAVSVAQSTREFREVRGQRMIALAGAGLAEILAPDGTIRVSTDPSRIRSRMDLGPSRADEGRAWFGDDDLE